MSDVFVLLIIWAFAPFGLLCCARLNRWLVFVGRKSVCEPETIGEVEVGTSLDEEDFDVGVYACHGGRGLEDCGLALIYAE